MYRKLITVPHVLPKNIRIGVWWPLVEIWKIKHSFIFFFHVERICQTKSGSLVHNISWDEEEYYSKVRAALEGFLWFISIELMKVICLNNLYFNKFVREKFELLVFMHVYGQNLKSLKFIDKSKNIK